MESLQKGCSETRAQSPAGSRATSLSANPAPSVLSTGSRRRLPRHRRLARCATPSASPVRSRHGFRCFAAQVTESPQASACLETSSFASCFLDPFLHVPSALALRFFHRQSPDRLRRPALAGAKRPSGPAHCDEIHSCGSRGSVTKFHTRRPTAGYREIHPQLHHFRGNLGARPWRT